MFNLMFSGVASTPYWYLEIDKERSIEFAATTTKTASHYRSFVEIASKLPELFDALAKSTPEIFEELLPHFVELMGLKQCVLRILKAHGWVIHEVNEGYATFKLDNCYVSGMYMDGTFFWMKQTTHQETPWLRTGGSEIIFKSVADDDFDWTFVEFVTKKKPIFS